MRRSTTLPLAVALLAGCAHSPERLKEAPAAVPSSEMIQAAQVANYATAVQTLVQGNATAQAEVMAHARDAYGDAKAGPAALRYGLLLAAPGHPLRDARMAQHVLREAMAQAELLTPVERALGAVELARMDNELLLVTEIDRLVSELQAERERTRTAAADTAVNKLLQAERDESARLRKALDEAKAKLDAITRMERNFSDRPPAPEGRNP